MNILYKHNAEAYEKVKKMMETNDRTCIVHATGTGKSFIALQLIIDFLEANSDKHIYYITPLNGIKNQILEHVEKLNLPNEIKELLDNVKFVTYQSLTVKNRKELSDLDADLLVIDEFHHLGAREWTAAINQIVSTHPEIKIFGMSATSVRERGNANEQDVAETFFEGNVASTYDLSNAIADGVLPAPNYHAALTFLEDECADLEEKINSGKASNEEKEQYNQIIKKIKQQISMMEVESTADIIRKYIKSNGKYIYFCPKINYDTNDTIESIQENFLKELPEELRGNVEFYQVHSFNYTERENNGNHYNFYHNITSDGKDASEKLRIMFAIDMYNEGIHVPDIDGVIMGRNTQSEIIFYQQLGRALAVKKNSDISEETPNAPLIIDLMDNFRQILKLYRKTEEQKKLKEDNTSKKEDDDTIGGSIAQPNFVESIPINFGIDDEIINILEEIDTVKEYLKSLSFEEKIEEAYEYFIQNGKLPALDNTTVKFSDGTAMGIWLSRNKKNLNNIQRKNNKAEAIIEELNKRKGLSLEEKIEEAYEYFIQNGKLPALDNTTVKFSDGTAMGIWLSRNKENVNSIQRTNNKAKTIIEELNKRKGLSFEGKLDQVYNYLLKHNELPSTNNKIIKFNDGVQIGQWLLRNKKKLEEMQEYDERARKIIEELNNRKGLSLEEKIEEAYEYFIQNGKLPALDNTTVKFSDGTAMGIWLSRNKENVNSIQRTNNKAKTIIEELNKRKGLSFEGKLDQVYNYLLKHNELPSTNNKIIKFNDGVQIGQWLLRNKKKLEEMQEYDERARKIIEELNNRKGLNFEEKLEQVYNYLLKRNELPAMTNRIIKFNDGVQMGQWLNSNKKKLEEMQEYNEHAKKIVEELSKRKGLNFEEKLDEAYKYLQEHDKLPSEKDYKIKFSDGTSLGSWLNRNKINILNIYEANACAKAIVYLILQINPDYFERTLRTLKAKEEFDIISKFEDVKQRISETKTKGKEDEGRKIQ